MGFKQCSLTRIVRVLRHPDFSRLRSITALTAGCCPVWVSPSGQLLTQEHASQFLLAAPGIPSCATRRTVSSCRRSRIDAHETCSACRCPFRSLEPARCRSLAAESLRRSSVQTDSSGVVASDVLRQVWQDTAGNWGSTNAGFTVRTGLAVPHTTSLRV